MPAAGKFMNAAGRMRQLATPLVSMFPSFLLAARVTADPDFRAFGLKNDGKKATRLRLGLLAASATWQDPRRGCEK